MARKIDRRILRTRKMLRESMMGLIMERGYDEISIQDVTDKANLGRATFYLHYKEKDDLLTDLLEQLFKEFSIQDNQLLNFKWTFEDEKVLQKLFEFAEVNYDFYRIMIFGKGGITASRMLQQSIATSIQRALEVEITQTSAEAVLPVVFIANHLAGELLSCIYWWLDNDMPFQPAEMARMYHIISSTSRRQLLKLPEPKNIVSAFIEERREKSRERRDRKNDRGSDNPKKDSEKSIQNTTLKKPDTGKRSKAVEDLQSGVTGEVLVEKKISEEI